MRRALQALCGLLALVIVGGAWGTEFPTRPIALVMSLGGGGADLAYRKLAQAAEKELGQSVVVLSKPGAGGTLGAAQMAMTAKPDGYTVAASFAGLLRQPRLQKVEWDPIRDFTWIIGLGGYTFAIGVREDSPFRNLQEMVAWAKANPGRLTYGTPGQGTSPHLLMETLARLAGFEAVHVPFKGGADVTTAMLGGHVMVNVNSVPSIVQHVEAGKARFLAIFNKERHPKLSVVQTAKEQGYDIVYSAPYGLVGPRNMPSEVVKRLHDAFKVALNDPSTQALLVNTLYDHIEYRSTEDYTEWALAAYQQERIALEQAGLLPK